MTERRRAVLITPEDKLRLVVPVEMLAQARGIDLSQPYAIVPDMQGNDVYVQRVIAEEPAEEPGP